MRLLAAPLTREVLCLEEELVLDLLPHSASLGDLCSVVEVQLLASLRPTHLEVALHLEDLVSIHFFLFNHETNYLVLFSKSCMDTAKHIFL